MNCLNGLKFEIIAQITLMRKFNLFFIAALLSISSFAQIRIGLFGGISNYNGDLTDKVFQKPKGAFGLTVGYELSGRLNVRAGFTYAKVGAADSLSDQTDLRLRNLSFQSSIAEFSLIGEYNIFDMDTKPFSPYLFAGLAVYRFNPYTFDRNNNQVYLQPLSTEGQGLPGYPKSYSLTQMALPFGGGLKYNVSDNFRIALELGMRKLFTDYLDDVSGGYADPNDLFANRGQQSVELSYRGDEVPGGDLNYPSKGFTRGSPKYKDYYYFTGIHLTYRIQTGDGSGFSGTRGKNKRYGCPTNF